MNTPEVRDGMIHQAQQERMVRDTLIMQKVNSAHREGFKVRFPGQVEHCMRLTAERLQAILTRKPTDLADPATWNCSAEEIRDLTVALDKLARLHHAYPMETGNESNQT
jgi:hypothetical protein